MKKTNQYLTVSVMLLLAVFASACRPQTEDALPTEPPAPASNTLTEETAPTDIPQPTNTAAPTDTPQSMFENTGNEEIIQFTPVITTSGTITETGECAKLTWIEDVTIPDGTVLDPGEVFLKVWRAQNSGTCDWILGYELAFDRGEQLDGPDVTLAHFYPAESGIENGYDAEGWTQEMDIVPPGESVDIPMILRAPETPGDYQSVWRVGDRDGIGIDFLWIEITVEERLPSTPGWNGVWYHSDPGTPFIAEEEFLVLEQTENQVSGYFYSFDGRIMIIEGEVSEDGQEVNGTFASPGQPDLKFTWRRVGSNFRGKYLLGQFGEGEWCGSRDEFSFPDPCGLD